MFNCAFHRIYELGGPNPVVYCRFAGNFFSAFAGDGAGLVQFPVLIFLGLSFAVAYTLVLVGLFWNATSAVTLTWLGEVYWTWLPVLLVGSLLGGYLGAHGAITKGSRWIKKIFEVITVVIGFKLLF